MALSPTQTAYTDADLKLIGKIETHIDSQLMRYRAPNADTVEVSFDTRQYIDEEIKDPVKRDEERLYIIERLLPGLIQNYAQVGWDVKQSSDGYDIILCLSPK